MTNTSTNKTQNLNETIINIPDWVPAIAKPFVKAVKNPLDNSTSINYIWYGTTQEIIGYKGFEINMTCRNMKYTIGCTNKIENFVGVASDGIHFCLKAFHVLEFYDMSIGSNNRMCQVAIPIGSIVSFSKTKCAANQLTVINEVLDPKLSKLLDGHHFNHMLAPHAIYCKATYKNGRLHSYNFPALYSRDLTNNIADNNNNNKGMNAIWYTDGVIGRKDKCKPYRMSLSKKNPNYVDFYFHVCPWNTPLFEFDNDSYVDKIETVAKNSANFKSLYRSIMSN